MKIARKISLSFLITTVILVTDAVSTIYLIVRADVKKEIFAHLATAAQSRASHVVSFLQNHKTEVELLASDVLLKNTLRTVIDNNLDYGEHVRVASIEVAAAELKEALEIAEDFYEIFVIDPGGKIIFSTDESNVGLDESANAYFLEGKKRSFIKDAYYSETTRKNSIAIATPILDDEDKQFLGVFVARLELTDLYRITTDTTGLGETGEIYLINKDGYMITPSRFKEDTFLKEKVDTENSRECLRDLEEYGSRARELDEREKQEEDIRIFDDYRGIKVVGTDCPIPEMQWGLLAEIDEKEAFAPLRKIRVLFVSLLISVPLVAWLIGVFVSRKITAPIHKLHEGTELIGEGNLAYRVGTDSKDEIGQLSRAFDKMTQDLMKTTTSIDELNKEVAERKMTEEALRGSEHKYRTLLECLPQKIFHKDRNSVYVSCNENYARDLKIKPEEISGKTDYEFFPKGLAEKYREDDKRIVTLKKTEEIEEKYIQEGQEVWVQTVKTPVKDEKGDITGVLGIFWDITERKRTEEKLKEYSEKLEQMVEERTQELREAHERLVRQEKLTVLGQLAGGLGHELRNPLGAIKNAVYLLNMILEEPEAEVKESLEIIEKEVGISERVISSLLDFARPKPSTRVKVDINEIVQATLSHVPVPENVEVVSRLDKTLPTTILGDPDQLTQAFGNFILNAIQAMPDGGRLVVKSDITGPNQVAVTFADTGVGIPQEKMKKIFEPLFTTKAKGIGLGLALTKLLIEAHGGTIEVKSEVEKGTTFTVSLPVGGENQK